MAHPIRYYRAGVGEGSLKELGGFAATLKLVMMMTQRGLAQREHGVGVRRFSRALAAVMALGIAVSCEAANTTKPEPRRVHTRHVLALQQGGSTGSKSHAKSGAKASAKRSAKTSSKGVGTRRSETATRSTRRRGRSVPVADHDAMPMHQVRAERRKGKAARRVTTERAEVREAKPRVAPAASGAESTSEDAALMAQEKPLTVDDFLRAAHGESSDANAPVAATGDIAAHGESHPDEDVRLNAQTAAPLPMVLKRPVVTRAVVSAPESAPAPIVREAPADLGAAPIRPETPKMDARAAVKDRASEDQIRAEARAAGLKPATQQELTAEVEQPVVLPGLYRNGRLVVPAPLKGTREILVHQNMMADDEGLQRVQDDFDLRRMRASRELVNFPESASLHVNPELGADRRCARPWTVRFATDISRAFYARFHEPLQVNSAVRTIAYQVHLQRVNGNAAGIEGEVASPHLTGQALDFGKRGMSLAQIAWMRAYLLPLMQAGKLDVEEEFQQACFHISVYRSYMPAGAKRRPVKTEVAQLREPRVPKAAPHSDEDQ